MAFLIIIIVIVVVGIYLVFILLKPSNPKGKVIISNNEFNVEIASNSISRSRGLSGRDGIEDNGGMLFIFNSSGMPAFWMKGMRFPLDIIWIRDNRIVSIEDSVPVENGKMLLELKKYKPPEPINWVLEINGGLTEKLGIKVGDRVNFIPD